MASVDRGQIFLKDGYALIIGFITRSMATPFVDPSRARFNFGQKGKTTHN